MNYIIKYNIISSELIEDKPTKKKVNGRITHDEVFAIAKTRETCLAMIIEMLKISISCDELAIHNMKRLKEDVLYELAGEVTDVKD